MYFLNLCPCDRPTLSDGGKAGEALRCLLERMGDVPWGWHGP